RGIDGSVVWADTMGVVQNGINESFCSNVIILPDGDIVGVGCTSNNGVDAWMVKYDGNGNLLWKRDFDKYGGNSHNYFWDIHQTYDKGFVICGDILNTNIGEKSMWVLKLDSNGCEIPNCTLGVTESIVNEDGLLVYPNPSSGIINFKLPEIINSNNTQLVIFDITGKVMLNTSFNTNSKQLDVSSYPKGIYFYQLTTGEERYKGKVVVQ
ncbi:MAG: T9SS type A sorting domain-containing protein, partial [Vicingaceae bacterium]|nr:T9SS type A sorting domain-containing protein [Vicingaceae bacterium]